MISRKDISVLIVGYQRPESINHILQQCAANGIRRVYVSIDAPRDSSDLAHERNLEIREICSSLRNEFDLLAERFLPLNIGCSANLLSACDWVFRHEEYVAVLEDDCIPSASFFDYLSDALLWLNNLEDLMLICGTQFAPEAITGSVPFMSKYSLTWGWATSSSKWNRISSEISSSASSRIPLKLKSSNVEEIYWLEGSRRAIQGFVDVWDTVLVNWLITNKFYALLPNQNLVTNVGNDGVATHTGNDKLWLHEPTGDYSPTLNMQFMKNPDADEWLKKNFYRIRFRHVISTRITRLMDFLSKTKSTSLVERWFKARDL